MKWKINLKTDLQMKQINEIDKSDFLNVSELSSN